MCEEKISGVGRLVALDSSGKEYTVDYVLAVTTDVTGHSATFSPPKVRTIYTLSINERNQSISPEPDYTLKTESEILRVRKLPTGWKVIRD